MSCHWIMMSLTDVSTWSIQPNLGSEVQQMIPTLTDTWTVISDLTPQENLPHAVCIPLLLKRNLIIVECLYSKRCAIILLHMPVSIEHRAPLTCVNLGITFPRLANIHSSSLLAQRQVSFKRSFLKAPSAWFGMEWKKSLCSVCCVVDMLHVYF